MLVIVVVILLILLLNKNSDGGGEGCGCGGCLLGIIALAILLALIGKLGLVH